MLEAIVDDVLGVLRGTFLSGDIQLAVIAGLSVLVAAAIMRRGTQISSMTIMALFLFCLGGYIRNLMATERGLDGVQLVRQFEASISSFMGLTAATLLAYFLAFMLVILCLFATKSVFGR